jgi:hypothetical protein
MISVSPAVDRGAIVTMAELMLAAGQNTYKKRGQNESTFVWMGRSPTKAIKYLHRETAIDGVSALCAVVAARQNTNKKRIQVVRAVVRMGGQTSKAIKYSH